MTISFRFFWLRFPGVCDLAAIIIIHRLIFHFGRFPAILLRQARALHCSLLTACIRIQYHHNTLRTYAVIVFLIIPLDAAGKINIVQCT